LLFIFFNEMVSSGNNGVGYLMQNYALFDEKVAFG